MAKIKFEAFIPETQPGGIMTLSVPRKDQPKVKQFLTVLRHKEGVKEKSLLVTCEMEIFYRKRTDNQNRLIWALCEILSQEIYNDVSCKEPIYYELCEQYAPRVTGKNGKSIYKTGSQCSTVEFAKVIEGAFMELASIGVTVVDPSQIGDYWKQFQEHRYSEKTDPLEIQTVKEYRERIKICEACGKYLGEWQTYRGNMAHIKSDGSGGPNEPWNMLHLCTDCHIKIQHQHGWNSFLELYPHLTGKVERALKR